MMESPPQMRPAAFSGHAEGDNGLMPATHRSAFIPTLLLSLAVVGWLVFQGLQLVREREQLAQARANLQPQELAASRIRASLDAVATSTAKLATEGNASAQVIVAELRKRGVTINPQPASQSK